MYYRVYICCKLCTYYIVLYCTVEIVNAVMALISHLSGVIESRNLELHFYQNHLPVLTFLIHKLQYCNTVIINKAKFYQVSIFFHKPIFLPKQLLCNQEDKSQNPNTYVKAIFLSKYFLFLSFILLATQ